MRPKAPSSAPRRPAKGKTRTTVTTATTVTFAVAELVQRLAAVAATQTEIADFTGIPIRTLERHLAAKAHPIAIAYRAGIEERRASLLRTMWVQARAGNVIMCIWLSKNLMGWKDRSEVDLKDIKAKLDKLTDEELLELGSGHGAHETK